VEQQNEKTEEMEVNINAKILFQAKYIREEHTIILQKRPRINNTPIKCLKTHLSIAQC
jgi:hypothetical protein